MNKHEGRKEGWKLGEGLARFSIAGIVFCLVAIVAVIIVLMWRGGMFDEPTYQQLAERRYRRAILGEFWFYIKLSCLVILALGFIVGVIAGARALWMTSSKMAHVRQRGGMYPLMPTTTLMMVRKPGEERARPRLVRVIYDPNRAAAPVAVIDGQAVTFTRQELDAAQLAHEKAVLAIQQTAANAQDGVDLIDVNIDADGANPVSGAVPTLTPLGADDITRLLREEGLG